MSEWLGNACEDLAITNELAGDLDVCANEAITNIISYAYKDLNSHKINIRLKLKEQRLILTIQDDGAAFDPFNSNAIDLNAYARIGDVTIGGLGIKLIKSLANECLYHRHNNKNIISLGFNLCQTSVDLIPGEKSPFLTSCNY